MLRCLLASLLCLPLWSCADGKAGPRVAAEDTAAAAAPAQPEPAAPAACEFDFRGPIDRVDSSCIGKRIEGTPKHRIIAAYFQAIARPAGRPYLADLYFDRDESRFMVFAYKKLRMTGGIAESHLLSVAFEDATHQAILLGADSIIPSGCLLLYEAVSGEEEYRLTSIRSGDTITQQRARWMAGDAVPSQPPAAGVVYPDERYVAKAVFWAPLHGQADGPVKIFQPSDVVKTAPGKDPTGSPAMMAESGIVKSHLRDGVWTIWRYDSGEDEFRQWRGEYKNGLEHGVWSRNIAGKWTKAETYDNGRRVAVHQP